METLLALFTNATLLLAGMAGLAPAQLTALFAATGVEKQPSSVELGIVELSPRGSEGGYAMPASNESNPVGPTLVVRARNLTTNGGYTNGTLNIKLGDEVEINWASTNTAGCTATEGPNFSTGGAVSGSDLTVDEPTTPDETIRYTVQCSVEGSAYPITGYVEVNVDPESCGLRHSPAAIVGGDDVSFSLFTTADADDAVLLRCNVIGPGGGCNEADHRSTVPIVNGQANFDWVLKDVVEGTSYAVKAYARKDGTRIAGCSDVFTPPTEPPPSAPPTEPPPPTPEDVTASMEVCNADGTNCVSNGSKTISDGTQVHINWNSTEADDCNFTMWDGDDGIGDAEERFGTDTEITEPLLGSSITYRLTCSNSEDVSPEQRVTVTTSAGVTSCPGGGTLTADPSIIRRGDSSTLEWTPPTDTAACTIEGPNLGADDVTTITPPPVTSCGAQPLITEVDPLSTATYTLTCDGTQVDQTTIRVVPSLEET